VNAFISQDMINLIVQFPSVEFQLHLTNFAIGEHCTLDRCFDVVKFTTPTQLLLTLCKFSFLTGWFEKCLFFPYFSIEIL